MIEHGFAVVTMHPMEYAARSDLEFEDHVDANQIVELEILLDAVEAEGKR